MAYNTLHLCIHVSPKAGDRTGRTPQPVALLTSPPPPLPPPSQFCARDFVRLMLCSSQRVRDGCMHKLRRLCARERTYDVAVRYVRRRVIYICGSHLYNLMINEQLARACIHERAYTIFLCVVVHTYTHTQAPHTVKSI